MSVSNGDKGNETTFNNAFVSRTTDSSTVGKLALNRTGSGGTIADAQQAINDNASNLATHEADTSVHGVTGDVVGTSDTQTLSNKTFSDSTTFSDTTDSADKDTGAVIVEGGVGIEKNLNVGGNTNITGNLTVNGTTTTVNSTTLDVSDSNITVNNGGNQSSADLNDAGITVEMSDATDALVHYDSTATSKFKCGESGTTKEIVTISDSQAITNKDIDGGTASNTNRITIPKNTKTNLDGLTRKEGTFVYATDTKKGYLDDGSTLQELGAGSGGGLDVFHTQDFEVYSSANATGNNATYLNGGTLDGAESLETTSPISGSSSWKYTASTASSNDWIEIETIDLDDKQKATDIKIRLIADMSGFANNVTFEIYDKTNLARLSDDLDTLVAGAARDFYEFSVFVPSTCNQISIGVHMKNGATSGESFLIDDIEVSTNPFVYKNLVETATVYGAGNGGTSITAGATDIDFTEVSDSNGAFDGTTYTVQNSNSVIKISGAMYFTATGVHHPTLYVNGSSTKKKVFKDESTTTNPFEFIITPGEVSVGDSITIRSDNAGGTLSNNTLFHYINIEETWQTEHVVTPAKSTLGDWTAYTPTTQGIGTPSGIDFYYRRVGDSVEILGSLTTGTTTASEAQIGLPTVDGTQLTVSSTFSGVKIPGYIVRADATTTFLSLISTAGDAFLNVSSIDGAADSDTPQNGSVVFASTTQYQFKATVPVEQWNSNATFLAAIPVPKVAYVKDVKSSGTGGGAASSGSYLTRDLNTVEGDSEIVSVSGNAFTLGSGTYIIEAISPGRGVLNSFKIRLQNTTDGTTTTLGSSEHAGGADDYVHSTLYTKVTLTASKTFEIQYRVTTPNVSTNALGTPASFGDNEVYTQVKITKIK